mmetsp:Transcript_21954/g.31820  ORF Transcript_21954/g.31820 Transcript_21954/m.31820 type:complete len:162 (+) Transcript_21954:127-612(+)
MNTHSSSSSSPLLMLASSSSTSPRDNPTPVDSSIDIAISVLDDNAEQTRTTHETTTKNTNSNQNKLTITQNGITETEQQQPKNPKFPNLPTKMCCIVFIPFLLIFLYPLLLSICLLHTIIMYTSPPYLYPRYVILVENLKEYVQKLNKYCIHQNECNDGDE